MKSTYIAKHKNYDIRMSSRSGGAFTAFSDVIIDEGGCVFGVKMEDAYTAVHAVAYSKKERDEFRGSKYIQSVIGDTFKIVKNELDKNRLVLFTGTPCQIDGLISFLGYIPEKLFLVDLVCHGVPSPGVWKKYVNWFEKTKNCNVENVDFRNKKTNGWRAHLESFQVGNHEFQYGHFSKMFYSHNIVRPSCFKCPYKNLNRVSDITIADAWGIEKDKPYFNDNKGVSLIIVNTLKGEELFNRSKEFLDYILVDIKNYIQQPLKSNYSEPKTRNKFWRDFEKLPFVVILLKYGAFGFKRKLKSFFMRVKSLFKGR